VSILIDINTIAPVFDEQNTLHHGFAPVRAWILDGPGRFVFGGTKYKNELRNAYRFLRLVRQLKDARRACEIRQDLVDQREREVIAQTEGTDCDDQHLIAILDVSGCLLFCSNDKRADKFIKDQRWYSKGRKRPSIYRSVKHRDLLSNKFLVELKNVD
jgi:hypothetical protein